MEVRVTIANKTWVVPAGNVDALRAWLNANGVELGAPKQEVREIVNNDNDSRTLITE
jgi:hypothetical protein